jgi:hypothetical protein
MRTLRGNRAASMSLLGLRSSVRAACGRLKSIDLLEHIVGLVAARRVPCVTFLGRREDFRGSL